MQLRTLKLRKSGQFCRFNLNLTLEINAEGDNCVLCETFCESRWLLLIFVTTNVCYETKTFFTDDDSFSCCLWPIIDWQMVR